MLLLVFAKILVFVTFCNAMTMKQVRNTGSMMRKSCQPKNNVEDEKIDPIGKGVFIEDKNVMCYIACVMKMANTVKNGKLSYDLSVKQVDLILPEDIKERAKAALADCKKIMETPGELCETAFKTTRCIYNAQPEIFYFP